MAKANDIYGGGDFLKAADLQGKRHPVTIESWEVKESQFGKQIVLSFVGKDKKFSLNKTNARMITDLLGTDDTDEWIGKTISLRPDKTQNPEGAMVDCIRVDFELPEQVAAAPSYTGVSNYGSHVKPQDDSDVPF